MSQMFAYFSEEIKGLSPAACIWVDAVLNVGDGEEEELKDFGIKMEEEIEPDFWPGFDWVLEDKRLWLSCEDSFCADNLIAFIQALIKKFMPDYIFSVTIAEHTNSLEKGRFGGTWYVISKDKVTGGDTWAAAEKEKALIEKRREIHEHESGKTRGEKARTDGTGVAEKEQEKA